MIIYKEYIYCGGQQVEAIVIDNDEFDTLLEEILSQDVNAVSTYNGTSTDKVLANKKDVGFMATVNDRGNQVIFNRYNINTNLAFFIRRGFIPLQVKEKFPTNSDHDVVKAIEYLHNLMLEVEARNYAAIIMNPN